MGDRIYALKQFFPLLCGLGHADCQLQGDRVHLTLDHHRANQLPDVVDADQIVKEDVTGNAVVQLHNTNWSFVAEDFFILDRSDSQVLDSLYLQEVVDFAVEREVSREIWPEEGLLGLSEHVMPGSRSIGNEVTNQHITLVSEVIDETDGVTLECIPGYAHIGWETNYLLLVDDELCLEARWILIWVDCDIFHGHGQAVEVPTGLVMHEDLGVLVAK